MLAKPAALPDVGTVLAINNPFGPGDMISSAAMTAKARIVEGIIA
jgi:hypothetical protein